MIYVNLSAFQPSEDWKRRASSLTERLVTMTNEQRRDFINAHSDMWTELKSDLERLSNHKCWYCERKKVREDFNVDHFRPKNSLRKSNGTTEEGYWYLAFDYKNFRVACDWCNSKHIGNDGVALGKQDQFPLDERCTRASWPSCNINEEIPLLLDPSIIDDPPVLWFLDTGEVCIKNDDGQLQKTRVNETIRVLHLNHIFVAEARKEVWRKCRRLVKRADRKLQKYNETGSMEAKREYAEIIEEMKEFVCPRAEFSATARACFQSSRYYWVNNNL